MRVKMILPALTEATSPFFRPVKYSLFPPLGLATLAAYLRDDLAKRDFRSLFLLPWRRAQRPGLRGVPHDRGLRDDSSRLLLLSPE